MKCGGQHEIIDCLWLTNALASTVLPHMYCTPQTMKAAHYSMQLSLVWSKQGEDVWTQALSCLAIMIWHSLLSFLRSLWCLVWVIVVLFVQVQRQTTTANCHTILGFWEDTCVVHGRAYKFLMLLMCMFSPVERAHISVETCSIFWCCEMLVQCSVCFYLRNLLAMTGLLTLD